MHHLESAFSIILLLLFLESLQVIDLKITDLTSKATKMSRVQLPVKGGLSIVHQQLLRPFIITIIKIINTIITVLMMITITIFITISPPLLIPTSSP